MDGNDKRSLEVKDSRFKFAINETVRSTPNAQPTGKTLLKGLAAKQVKLGGLEKIPAEVKCILRRKVFVAHRKHRCQRPPPSCATSVEPGG